MPETCWESVDNKHLTVATCWFYLSLHNLLTMHGHRNLKPKPYVITVLYVRCGVCLKTKPQPMISSIKWEDEFALTATNSVLQGAKSITINPCKMVPELSRVNGLEGQCWAELQIWPIDVICHDNYFISVKSYDIIIRPSMEFTILVLPP